LAHRVAVALSYDYSDKVTAETFVRVEELADYVNARKRAVQGVLSTFSADGYLTKVKDRRRGSPTTYRLTFPGEQPNAAAARPSNGGANPNPNPNPPNQNPKPNQPATPKTWNEYVAYCRAWLNAESDIAAIKARWDSAHEKAVRATCCGGQPDAFAECNRMLEQRLRYSNAHSGEDEVPF
jgi:hypothetical protein